MVRVGIDIHTIGLKQTGNETYVQNLIRVYEAGGHEDVDFRYYHTQRAALPGWNGQVRRIWPHIPALRIPISFPIALKRDAIDVAHFQYHSPPACPCPVVLTIHDVSYERFPEFFRSWDRARMRWLIPAAARRASRIITVSESSKQDIMEVYGIAPEKISVTYNGVSDQFTPCSDRERLERATRRFGLDRPFILSVGNLEPRKNLERLVRVYARLRKSGKLEHDLVLAGKPGWQTSRITSEIDRLGVGPNVHLTGFVTTEELVALYNRAEYMVYVSLYEGFGLPISESMACGTPVITSNVSSMPEVAGEAAVLVDPRDDEALGQAMCELVEDEGLRERLSEAGRVQCKNFSWPACADATIALYQQVAEEGLL